MELSVMSNIIKLKRNKIKILEYSRAIFEGFF